jgi:ketosteroid isomerase-like protein
MGTAENKALVLRYMKFVEQGQIDQALAADDAVFWHPGGGETDKPGVRASFQKMAPITVSFRTTILSVTAEDDRVAVEVTADMEFKNGRHYHNRYVTMANS